MNLDNDELWMMNDEWWIKEETQRVSIKELRIEN